MSNFKSLIKKIIILIVCIYGISTFIHQQKILNTYACNSEQLDAQINIAEEQNKELNQMKENVNSSEYIEQVAREKLNMYLPNERVYVDNSK